MRRFFTVIMVAAAVGLCSCGGSKKDLNLEAQVCEFEAVCARTAELGERVKEGDMSVAKEFEASTAAMTRKAQALASQSSKLTSEQAERMLQAAEKAEAAVKCY